jgi:hypothetical protein
MKVLAAAAAVLALLVAAVASAAFRGGGGTSRATSSGASCSDQGWAATAAGRPALVSSSGRSVYVWRGTKGWHLRVSGGSRSAPLAGEVRSTSRLHTSNVGSAMRPGLRSSARRFTFRVTSTGLSGLDFDSPCARSLSFRLATGQTLPAGVASGGPAGAGQGTALRVFLGASGRAPGTAFRLARPAGTGVAGRILIGPTCPVVRPDCPPAKPATGTVRIETAPTRRGATGRVVARVKSDGNGNYSTDLAPGRYVLVVEKSGGYPTSKPSNLNVEAGVVTLVDLYLDSGIR